MTAPVVVIAGGGPTGLMVAGEVAWAGVTAVRIRGRLPLSEALRDGLGPLLFASAVQHLEVCGIVCWPFSASVQRNNQ